MKKSKIQFRVRDCQKLSLNTHSNVNWGFAVSAFQGDYKPAPEDWEDIAWFNSKPRALGYVKLLKELAGQ